MKRIMLPFLFASALLLVACGSKKEEVDQGELLHGQPNSIMNNCLKASTKPSWRVRTVRESCPMAIGNSF